MLWRYYDEYEILKIPVEVRLGYGRILDATMIGNVKAIFNSYGKPKEINIFIVYFVKIWRII